MAHICQLYSTGDYTIKSLASSFGVSQNTVSKIVYYTRKQGD